MLYGRMWATYAKQWDAMTIKPARAAEFNERAQYAIDNRSIYMTIERLTGVPWPLIACIHMRESDAQDKHGNPLFTSYLGNGQPLKRRTTIVPKGRGPFLAPAPQDFIDGAIDALEYDHLTRVIDWRLEKILYNLELFNGFGYFYHGVPSCYLFGGTNIQKVGKFKSDNDWAPNMWDTQPGCAPMLKIIMLDQNLQYQRED